MLRLRVRTALRRTSARVNPAEARRARAVDQLAGLGALDHAGRVEDTLVRALVHLEVGGLLEVGAGRLAALLLADLLQAVHLALERVRCLLHLALVTAEAGADLVLLELDSLAINLEDRIELRTNQGEGS